MDEFKWDGASFEDVKFKAMPAPPGTPKPSLPPDLMSHKGTISFMWDPMPYAIAAFVAAVRKAMRDEAERN